MMNIKYMNIVSVRLMCVGCVKSKKNDKESSDKMKVSLSTIVTNYEDTL